jgi:hypothetical protein
VKTTAVLARARTALTKERATVAAQLDYFDRVLAALNGLRPGVHTRGKIASRRKFKATPRQLANLKKARRVLAAKRKAAAKS